MLPSRFLLLSGLLILLSNTALAHHEESMFSPLAHAVSHALPWLLAALATAALVAYTAWRMQRSRNRPQSRHDRHDDA